jgi:5-methylthioadenosine/S-adenosylhomocysteine deaminase
MGTRGGAAILGLEAGQLESGMLADFIGIDVTQVSLLPWSPETLMANMVYAMSPEAITDVIVGGHPVVRDGHLVKEDDQTIAAEVQIRSRRWLDHR